MGILSWTSTEWSAVGSLLSGVGTIVGAISVLVAAWLASNTFEGWRRQKLSERRIEQAERLLTATYKARRALGYVRSPLVLAHELKVAEEFLEKQDFWLTVSPKRKDRLISSQATLERLNKVFEDRRELDECLPMARALFGEKVEAAVETLNKQFHFVSIAADANSWEDNDSAFQKSIREDLFSGSDSRPNSMDTVIAAQVKLIEDECVPVLRIGKERLKG